MVREQPLEAAEVDARRQRQQHDRERDRQAAPAPAAAGSRRAANARVPPRMTTKNSAIAATSTASVISQPLTSCQAGSVKR